MSEPKPFESVEDAIDAADMAASRLRVNDPAIFMLARLAETIRADKARIAELEQAHEDIAQALADAVNESDHLRACIARLECQDKRSDGWGGSIDCRSSSTLPRTEWCLPCRMKWTKE